MVVVTIGSAARIIGYGYSEVVGATFMAAQEAHRPSSVHIYHHDCRVLGLVDEVSSDSADHNTTRRYVYQALAFCEKGCRQFYNAREPLRVPSSRNGLVHVQTTFRKRSGQALRQRAP